VTLYVTGNSPTASSTTQGSSAQQRTATARNPYGTSPTGQVYPLGTQQGQGCNVHPERIGSSQIYHHRQSSPLCLRFSPKRLNSPDAVLAVLYSVQIFGGIRPFSAFFPEHHRGFTSTEVYAHSSEKSSFFTALRTEQAQGAQTFSETEKQSVRGRSSLASKGFAYPERLP